MFIVLEVNSTSTIHIDTVTMKLQILLVTLGLAELHCNQHQYRPTGCQTHHYALKEQFYWDILDFKFPNVSARNIALATGSYIPKNNNIWGIGIWKDKMFVSVQRFGVGVASSLNYFSINSVNKSPVLIPYPSFEANYVNEDPQQKTLALPSNSSIICAGFFRIDKCDRLWALDSGFVDYNGERRILTAPALLIFDLKTDTLLKRYTIPVEFVNSNTAYTNLDIDFKGNGCDDAYAYIVDMFRSIVVYSLEKDRSWRMVHNFFGSDPLAGNFYYEGQNIQWNFGVLGITIGDYQTDGSRRVYVNPFASTKSYYVSNKVLQNEAYIGLNDYYDDVHLLGDRGKNGQIFTWAYDEKTNVLFDTQFYRRRIGCWNTANPYIQSNFAVVYKKNPTFFPEDIRIDRNRNLWIITNNLPTFFLGEWNANSKNIQIFKGQIDDVISGTVCK